MIYIPRDQVEWKQVTYLKTSEEGPEENHVWKYEFSLPRPLADWDVWAVWEKERIASMDAHLKQGDVIVGWNDEKLSGVRSLLRSLGPDSVGAVVDVAILRGGEPIRIKLTIGERADG